MKLVSYFQSSGVRLSARLGALTADEAFVVDLNRADNQFRAAHPSAPAPQVPPFPPEMVAFLTAGDAAMQHARQVLQFIERERQANATDALTAGEVLHPIGTVQLSAPVPRPPKLIAIWVNYYEHGREAVVEPPQKAPLFFSKFITAVIGPQQPIVLPKISQKVDYEAELAFVVGRRAKSVPAEQAYDYIAGYTIMNDVSARDFSLRALLGVAGPSDIQKSFDTFAPTGPCLVTRDDIPDPHSLGIRLWIGDEILQNSNTSYMIHRIPEIFAYISSVATLEPGDVITTGTPEGVGFTRNPPRWLRPGEIVRIEIDKIGVLENPVVAES